MAILELEDDVIEEILARLPAKSILRLRCVCKSWLSLSHSPGFANMQVKRASSNPDISTRRLIVCTYLNDNRSVDCETSTSFDDLSTSRLLKFPFHASLRFKILGSSNGLLCVSTETYTKFHLWNPMTGEYFTLPVLDYGKVRHRQGNLVARYGFGYDPSTDDYKIFIATIDVNNIYTTVDAVVYLFSLKKGSWRRFKDAKYPGCFYGGGEVYPPELCGVYLNGSLHWVYLDDERNKKRVPDSIVSFCLTKETFKTIPLPYGETFWFNNRYDQIGVLDGSLCFTFYIGNSTSKGHSIWMMKEYGVKSSWTETNIVYWNYNVQHQSDHCQTLCFTRKDEIIMKKNLSTLVCFDTKTGSCKYFEFEDCSVEHPVYVESLVSPNALFGVKNNHKRKRCRSHSQIVLTNQVNRRRIKRS